jgi:energy-coupling factor transport system ATP-binding protein
VKLSEIIKQIRQRNVLIVIVSHDLDFINMTCSRVIELEHGQIKNVNRGNIND